MANRLAQSTSPYLLQHADNPVDWYEWGEEAFSEARRRQVPILLSVGYSACHWCHVMAHESFEDPATASEMNALFVNVKVDREERPDVDSVYMEAVQAMSGHGGWPMTVFLTPDLKPFFAGTYFPKDDRAGMPSFRRVMGAITEAWTTRPDDVAEQAERVISAISTSLPVADQLPGADAIQKGYDALVSTFDPVHGGFGAAPKFPQPPSIEFLLRNWQQPFAHRAKEMITKTLEEIARGGIHDQLGGGFARYSVDGHWLVPHFEKMLYDNAQLARLYLWAGIEFDNPAFVGVARRTFEYLLRDLRHPDGGFYSAEDADSEGEEGRFYVWSYDEFMEVAGQDARLAADHFGVSSQGNFEGSNVLHLTGPLDNPTEAGGVESARQALFDRRLGRVRPGLDDKVLAGWNGLAIRAFAEAGAALGEPRYIEAASDAARFVIERMFDDGVLKRGWAKGKASVVDGFLDDYAAMGIGLLSLYAATGSVEWYRAGEGLIRRLEGFTDPEGGFFTAAAGTATTELPKRPKDVFDNPSPSGNSLAAEALLMLSLYTGDADLYQQATDTLRSQALVIDRYPTAAMHALSVISSIERGTHELAVVGTEHARLASVYWRRLRPHIVLASAPTADATIPLLVARGEPGITVAYLCSGFVCQSPVSDESALTASLDST